MDEDRTKAVAESTVHGSPVPPETSGASAIVLSWKRPGNISRITEALAATTFVREIIVWNNNGDLQLDCPGCKVINASHNFMPFARYAAALLARCDTILFQDDDMLFAPAALETAYAHYLRDRWRIYGTAGRNLDNGKYNRGRPRGECDIVLGQFMLFDKRLLVSVLSDMYRLAPFERGDDIAFSLLCRRRHIALGLDYEDLGKRDDVALHRQPGHSELRQASVDRVLDLMARNQRD